MKHGIDCPCDGCKEIRKALRDTAKSNIATIVGLDSDVEKIMMGD